MSDRSGWAQTTVNSPTEPFASPTVHRKASIGNQQKGWHYGDYTPVCYTPVCARPMNQSTVGKGLMVEISFPVFRERRT
eukprot:2713870-Amphidinium_carterae.1